LADRIGRITREPAVRHAEKTKGRPNEIDRTLKTRDSANYRRDVAARHWPLWEGGRAAATARYGANHANSPELSQSELSRPVIGGQGVLRRIEWEEKRKKNGCEHFLLKRQASCAESTQEQPRRDTSSAKEERKERAKFLSSPRRRSIWMKRRLPPQLWEKKREGSESYAERPVLADARAGR